ncbi:MAG: hypothetical protein KDA93_11950 [Planctomycetaceae bacterium]|nr:hypothetical protein [Planctomycetaceae bacterium]
MRTHTLLTGLVLTTLLLTSRTAMSADVYGLETGTPDIQSAGPLAFAPDGILLVGDTKGAAIFAIGTDDKSGDPASANVNVEDIAEKIAGQIGVNPKDLTINDLAVNPASGNLYLSVTADERPSVVKVSADGEVSQVSLKNIPFSKAVLPNAPEDKVVQRGRRSSNPRTDAITDLAFVDGQVLVSGLASGDSPSNVRTIPFPFSEINTGASLEIYHGAHGKSEDYAAIRTFVPFVIDGKPNVLAGFVCTPLVRFPIEEVNAGEKVVGTTVAELGNHNRPLDMIAYQKDGRDYLLLSNSARGVMKIDTASVATQEGISERVEGGGTAGLPYETIGELENVVQLDRLNDTHAVVITDNDGVMNLTTIALP